MSKSARRYSILDVFTDEALAGNPLAVVLDSEGLSDEQMLKIAKEFNLSETVFVCAPSNPAHNASLRIFTPQLELPFAGHPTVGTAVLLGLEKCAEVKKEMDCMVVLEEKIGLVRCAVKIDPDGCGEAVFELPKEAEPVAMALGSKDEIAAALGLHIEDIGFENHVPTVYSAGVPFAMVPLKNLDAVQRAKPVMPSWNTAFGSHAHNDAFVYSRETVKHTSNFHTRMFAPGMGIVEDPATGSAVAAFSGVIRKFDRPMKGSNAYIIEQGFEMERPSIIHLELDVEGEAIKAARIGGKAVRVASGTLYI